MSPTKLAEHLLNAAILNKRTQLSLDTCEQFIREEIKAHAIGFYKHIAEPDQQAESLMEDAWKSYEEKFLI